MKNLLFALLLIIPLIGYTQNQQDYSKYVDSKLKLKTQKLTGADFEESITYLGDLTLYNGQVFYVLTSFRTVQAALVKHGHTDIFILDINKKIFRQYSLNLPEELPFRVKRGSLYFHYQDENTGDIKVFANKLGNELPKLMCVGPNGNCY